MAEEAPVKTDSAASMIKAGLPAFEVKPDAIAISATEPLRRLSDPAELAPSTGVVRMSPYVTLEKKVLTSEAVMSDKGLEFFAMDKFIGDIDGLDRGFLNVVTLRGLWSRIPVLNLVDFAGETNEERAMRLYRLNRKSEILKEKQDFDALSKSEAQANSK